MSVNVATLIAKLEAQTRDFDRNIANSEKQLNRLTTATGSATSGMTRMGNMMRGAAALGLVAFGKELFGLGVQVEAWGRRFDTVFDESGAALAEWADSMNERMGMSEDRLRGAAAAVGDLFVPMGYTRQAAADMTQEVLTLSAALSEWTGGTMSAEAASNAITRAILGEREALIPLGVKISELDIQARLAAKGMDQLEGEALQQAKAMITLELITERSADAMAAFAEGGSEAMVASNNMKAAMDELKVSLSGVIVEIAPLVSATAQLIGILATPFSGRFVSELQASADGVRLLTAADLEAVRANDMLYEAIKRVQMALGGKEGGKGATYGKVPTTPNAFGYGRHSGGLVPGASGASVPIMAMAGERVIPAGLSSGGGGGTSVNVYVAGSVVSERDLVDAVRRGLRGERIRGGSLEL